MIRMRFGVVAVLALAVVAAGCSSSSSSSSSASGSSTGATGSTGSTSGSAGSPLKVAFIYDGSATDENFNQEADIGRQAVEAQYGSKVQTTFKENVPEGPSATQVAQSLISQGYKLFFVNGTGFETYFQPLAKANPDVRFEEFESAVSGGNYGAYNVNIAEADYLAGMALAAGSKTGHLGIVASFPFPGILTQINGFELGAQAVNPNATLRTVFISSFYDPAKETQAAQALVSGGADGLVADLNDGNTCQVAEKAGIPCIANTLLNGASDGPTTYLTDARFVWTPIMIQVVGDVLAGKTVSDSIFEGYAQGAAALGPDGPAYDKWVSPTVQSQMAAKEAALKSGTFNVYQGPLKDQTGAVRVPAGQALAPDQITSIHWAVQGVIGSISSK